MKKEKLLPMNIGLALISFPWQFVVIVMFTLGSASISPNGTGYIMYDIVYVLVLLLPHVAGVSINYYVVKKWATGVILFGGVAAIQHIIWTYDLLWVFMSSFH